MSEKPKTASPPLMRAFNGLRPLPEYAADVAAPPYDVVSFEEARDLAKGKPWSFLHISRPEIDLPEGTDPYADEVYTTGAENLTRLVDRGVLVRDPAPSFYVYRLKSEDHEQIGVVGAASVAAYDSNRIRRHELTRPAKEDDRVRQIDVVNAQTGPVLLAHRPNAHLDDVLRGATESAPDYAVTDQNMVEHAVWALSDAATLARVGKLFEAMKAVYIADGHHRSAAASRVAAMRRESNPYQRGDEVYESFLAVSFPSDQMRILDYNRVIRDLGDLSADAFLNRIRERFSVEPSEAAVRPRAKAEFGLYMGGRWYRLRALTPPSDDPRESLDVSILAHRLLEPLLGVTDARRDPRIDFVGGIRGLGVLEQRVDRDGWAAAFSLFPTSMDELMAVAEADEVMPPKSTWFEPKLADGLVSYPLD